MPISGVHLARCAFSVLFCALTQAGANGQSILPPEQTQTDPAEADAPHFVSIHVGVHDRKKRLVTDLKPAEISLTDAGRPVDSGLLRITDDGATGDHAITLLFDKLDAAGRKNAAHAARSILKNLAADSSEVGVWALEDGLRMVQPYSSDQTQVEIAIGEATGDRAALAVTAAERTRLLLGAQDTGDMDARAPRQKRLDRSALSTVNEAPRLVREEHVPWTIASLLATAQAQRPLRGRKAIILFTQTVPKDLDAADRLRTVSRKMRDASISFFVVDLNALDTDAAEGMAASMAMGNAATSNHLNPAPALTGPASGYQGFVTKLEAERITDTITDIELDGTASGKNLLAQLAESTGGAYSDVDGSVKNICRLLTEDLDRYYTITYPADEHLDGRFRAILIKVTRPGVNATGRAGYFGLAQTDSAAGSAPTTTDDSVDSAGSGSLAELNDGAVASDLSLHAAMLRLGETPTAVHEVLAVEVPIQKLDLHEDPNTNLFSLHVTIAAELRDAAGKPVARFHEEFRRHGSMDAAEKVREGFLTMDRSTTLTPGEYRLDAVVRDWNTDEVGTVTQPLHVEASEDASVLSDLVLVRSTEITHEGDNAPLPYGHGRIVPNLSGNLSGASKEVSLYFQMYADAKDAAGVKPQLRLEISKDGKLLANLPMKIEATPLEEASSRVANLKLGNGDGAYDLTLHLDRGGRIVTRHISVTRSTDPPSVSADAHPVIMGKDAPDQIAPFEPPSVDLDLKPSTRTLPPNESVILLSEARDRALAYTHSLPNFICVEKIERMNDPKGTGAWKHRDSMAELIRYIGESETRVVLNVDGEKKDVPADKIQGMHSDGEFGGILQIIFNPESAADFQWLKTEEKDGQVLQVFSYEVEAKHSQYLLTDHNHAQMFAPFHGLVLIDNDTRSVRRLVAQTDALPGGFGIKASWMTVDYDYIGINGHDYLLPTSGEVGLQRGRSQADLNRLNFSDYRRFGSQVHIVTPSK